MNVCSCCGPSSTVPSCYSSTLVTSLSSLFTLRISERSTVGPGPFLAPGSCGFFSSAVTEALSSRLTESSLLFTGCPAPGRKAPIGILMFACMARTFEEGCLDIFHWEVPSPYNQMRAAVYLLWKPQIWKSRNLLAELPVIRYLGSCGAGSFLRAKRTKSVWKLLAKGFQS